MTNETERPLIQHEMIHLAKTRGRVNVYGLQPTPVEARLLFFPADGVHPRAQVEVNGKRFRVDPRDVEKCDESKVGAT